MQADPRVEPEDDVREPEDDVREPEDDDTGASRPRVNVNGGW